MGGHGHCSAFYRGLAELCRRTSWFPGSYKPSAGGVLVGYAQLGSSCSISLDVLVRARQGRSFGSVVLFGSTEREPVPGLWLFPHSARLHANYNWAGGDVMQVLQNAPELPLGRACRVSII